MEGTAYLDNSDNNQNNPNNKTRAVRLASALCELSLVNVSETEKVRDPRNYTKQHEVTRRENDLIRVISSYFVSLRGSSEGS
jgi:hypothetical protein